MGSCLVRLDQQKMLKFARQRRSAVLPADAAACVSVNSHAFCCFSR